MSGRISSGTILFRALSDESDCFLGELLKLLKSNVLYALDNAKNAMLLVSTVTKATTTTMNCLNSSDVFCSIETV